MAECADQTQGRVDGFGPDGAANALGEESPMPEAIPRRLVNHHSASGRGGK